jgi:hypothetical protein
MALALSGFTEDFKDFSNGSSLFSQGFPAAAKFLKPLQPEGHSPWPLSTGGSASTVSSGTSEAPKAFLDQNEFALPTGLFKNTQGNTREQNIDLASSSDSITKGFGAKSAAEKASALEAQGDYFGASSIRSSQLAKEQQQARVALEQSAKRQAGRDLTGDANDTESEADLVRRFGQKKFEDAAAKRKGPQDQQYDSNGKPIQGKGDDANPLVTILQLIKDHLPKIDDKLPLCALS